MAKFTRSVSRAILACALCAALGACATSAPADAQPRPLAPLPSEPQPNYVDLVELAQTAGVVARIGVEEQIVVPAERAPGLAPGEVRLYLQALTQSLLGGTTPIGESLAFLADLPRNAEGDSPELEERVFIIFANSVPGRAGELQLAARNAMLTATPELEARVRRVLTQLAEGARPPVITGVREAISIPGNLAGESETQIFLETQSGAPVSFSVIRRPGMAPDWGVSLTEIVDQAAQPPEPETLLWYSLACFLPDRLPDEVFLQPDGQARAQAREDYALIREQIGPCQRAL